MVLFVCSIWFTAHQCCCICSQYNRGFWVCVTVCCAHWPPRTPPSLSAKSLHSLTVCVCVRTALCAACEASVSSSQSVSQHATISRKKGGRIVNSPTHPFSFWPSLAAFVMSCFPSQARKPCPQLGKSMPYTNILTQKLSPHTGFLSALSGYLFGCYCSQKGFGGKIHCSETSSLSWLVCQTGPPSLFHIIVVLSPNLFLCVS